MISGNPEQKEKDSVIGFSEPSPVSPRSGGEPADSGDPKKSENTLQKDSRKKSSQKDYIASKARIEQLTEEVKSLKEIQATMEDRYLRLQAEFDNFRKRKSKEIMQILEYEGEEVIKTFLPVMDDLERVIKLTDGSNSAGVETVVEGVNMILEKLRLQLKNLGVHSFDSVGTPFDPDLHEAVMMKTSNEVKDHYVIEEFERGYKYKDKVIRHSKVVVNMAGGQEKADDDKA